ncbi:hypothetical protein K2X30_09845 [bacterium]|nr:hypothetical protein [bacterium]
MENISRWLDLARWAPSGDNSQPWDVRFEEHTDALVFRISVKKDSIRTVFDQVFHGSYVSLGTFSQNLVLLAEAEGYFCTKIDVLTEVGQPATFVLTFRQELSHGSKIWKKPIEELIRHRRVTRYPYQVKPLDPEILEALQVSLSEFPEIRFSYLESPYHELASLFFKLDKFRYRHSLAYNQFLDELRTETEFQRTQDGLALKSLGTPLPAQWFLLLLRRFRWLHFLIHLGVGAVMAYLGGYFLIVRSGAIGALCASSNSPLSWFRFGMAFQKVWLSAVDEGLAFQPMGTPLLVYSAVAVNDTDHFSPRDRQELQEISKSMLDRFKIDLEKPCVFFRIGKTSKVAPDSARKPMPPLERA